MKISKFGRTIEVNAGTVRKNLVTRRVVVRVSKDGGKSKLALLFGVSSGERVAPKFFVRTGLFDGLRLSVGGIRKTA